MTIYSRYLIIIVSRNYSQSKASLSRCSPRWHLLHNSISCIMSFTNIGPRWSAESEWMWWWWQTRETKPNIIMTWPDLTVINESATQTLKQHDLTCLGPKTQAKIQLRFKWGPGSIRDSWFPHNNADPRNDSGSFRISSSRSFTSASSLKQKESDKVNEWMFVQGKKASLVQLTRFTTITNQESNQKMIMMNISQNSHKTLTENTTWDMSFVFVSLKEIRKLFNPSAWAFATLPRASTTISFEALLPRRGLNPVHCSKNNFFHKPEGKNRNSHGIIIFTEAMTASWRFSPLSLTPVHLHRSHHAFHRPFEPASEPLVAPNRRSCLFQACGHRHLARGTLCSIFQGPGTRIEGAGTSGIHARTSAYSPPSTCIPECLEVSPCFRPLSHGSTWQSQSLVCLMTFRDLERCQLHCCAQAPSIRIA